MDSKALSVYITQNSAGQFTDLLVMSKKNMAEPENKRGMTFSQTKKPTSSVSTYKFENLFQILRKELQKRIHGK